MLCFLSSILLHPSPIANNDQYCGNNNIIFCTLYSVEQWTHLKPQWQLIFARWRKVTGEMFTKRNCHGCSETSDVWMESLQRRQIFLAIQCLLTSESLSNESDDLCLCLSVCLFLFFCLSQSVSAFLSFSLSLCQRKSVCLLLSVPFVSWGLSWSARTDMVDE